MLKGDYSEQLFAARHCKSFLPTSVPSKWKKPPEVLSHPSYPGTPKRLPSLPQSPPLPHCRAAGGSHWGPGREVLTASPAVPRKAQASCCNTLLPGSLSASFSKKFMEIEHAMPPSISPPEVGALHTERIRLYED